MYNIKKDGGTTQLKIAAGVNNIKKSGSKMEAVVCILLERLAARRN